MILNLVLMPATGMFFFERIRHEVDTVLGLEHDHAWLFIFYRGLRQDRQAGAERICRRQSTWTCVLSRPVPTMIRQPVRH